jgi:hypothetical protein
MGQTTVLYQVYEPVFYQSSTITVDKGQEVRNVPININSDDDVSRYTYWSIEPDLPAGLLMDIVTGEITGVPAETLSITRTYTVTARTESDSESDGLALIQMGPSGNLNQAKAAGIAMTSIGSAATIMSVLGLLTEK